MLSLPSSPICLNIPNPPGIPFLLFDSLPVSQLGFPLLSENKMIKTNVCDGESNMYTIVNEFPQTFFYSVHTHTHTHTNIEIASWVIKQNHNLPFLRQRAGAPLMDSVEALIRQTLQVSHSEWEALFFCLITMPIISCGNYQKHLPSIWSDSPFAITSGKLS